MIFSWYNKPRQRERYVQGAREREGRGKSELAQNALQENYTCKPSRGNPSRERERESARDILFMCVGLKWNGTLLLASNYNLNCLGNLGRNAINRLKITVRRGKNTVKLQQVQLFELQVQSY